MTDTPKRTKAECGDLGGEALLRKLGPDSRAYFSQLGKLSAAQKKARKTGTPLPPELQAFIDMLNRQETHS